MSSICSIGAAAFENGVLVEEWYSLIDPKDYFADINVLIHCIMEADVHGAATFKSAMTEIESRLGGQIVVTHTHFERAE
jgi:DNA polymerase-3 subunit epsilon